MNFPVVTDDELRIYFGSSRKKGGNATDIFIARRKQANVALSTR